MSHETVMPCFFLRCRIAAGKGLGWPNTESLQLYLPGPGVFCGRHSITIMKHILPVSSSAQLSYRQSVIESWNIRLEAGGDLRWPPDRHRVILTWPRSFYLCKQVNNITSTGSCCRVLPSQFGTVEHLVSA